MPEPSYFGAHLASRAHAAGGSSAAAGSGSGPVVAIIGGGPVGMSLALALHQQGVACRIFDARARAAARQDPRTLALAHGSQLSLQQLGVWPQIAAQAAAILSIHVSQQGGFGCSRLTAAEAGVPALGQVVPLSAIATALDEALREAAIDYVEQQRITQVHSDEQRVLLRLSDGREEQAALVVHADGGLAVLEVEGAARLRQRDYGQHAIICDVTASTPHDHQAWERFTPQGPLALLPLRAARDYSVVYGAAPAEAARLLALDDAAFLAALQQHFGRRLQFSGVGPRQCFPLGLRYRVSPLARRCVWVGNAAQTLHPVAGQGFNLSLRDVMTLAGTLAQAADPGDLAVLRRYATRRRCDRLTTIGITDSLVRLFSNDLPPLRLARGLGLVALDMLPPLRGLLAHQMMYGLRV